MTERAANFNIELDDVSITSLTFGKEFTAAIEAKQVAAQEAERAKFIVEKAEQDKKSAVIRAQVRHIKWSIFTLPLGVMDCTEKRRKQIKDQRRGQEGKRDKFSIKIR